MAKYMFLICILLALVHENVSKPTFPTQVQKSNFNRCMASRKMLPAVSEQQDARKRGQLAFEICLAEKAGIINDDKTLNKEKLDKEAPNPSIYRDYRKCAASAVKAARPKDTKLDVYVTFGKCYTLAMENPPTLNENEGKEPSWEYSYSVLPIVPEPFDGNRKNSSEENMEEKQTKEDTDISFVLLIPEDHGPSYEQT